jgi:hypothetical protein
MFPTMFSNRIRRFRPVVQRIQDRQPAFALMTVAGAVPAVCALYRSAYLQAFKAVEKRVLRRCEVRAAKFVSLN